MRHTLYSMLRKPYFHIFYFVVALKSRFAMATARKIGEQAGAKIVIGRRVLYSVEKVKIAKLNQILTGYYHYYGITDNTESITAFRYNIMRSLFYCLNRRSQKKSYNWVEFLNMLDNSYPLVRPRIYVNIYE